MQSKRHFLFGEKNGFTVSRDVNRYQNTTPVCDVPSFSCLFQSENWPWLWRPWSVVPSLRYNGAIESPGKRLTRADHVTVGFVCNIKHAGFHNFNCKRKKIFVFSYHPFAPVAPAVAIEVM